MTMVVGILSNMDLIYDRHVVEEKLKNGTKYEKLAAIVYKVLEHDSVVIHDLRLSGVGKNTKHQIDVVIEKSNMKKRVLIECKDYSTTVGISVIRDFYGAVHQLKPDEAIVVTTHGFTREAINFAEDENIKLVVLREFDDSDWEGRIKEIHLSINILAITTPIISMIPANDTEMEKAIGARKNENRFQEISTQENYFYDNTGQKLETYQEVISSVVNSLERKVDEETQGEHLFDNIKYVKMSNDLIGVKGFNCSFKSHNIEEQSVIGIGEKIGLLLLKYIDGSEQKIIFDTDLSKWTFEENGTVVEKYN